VLLLLYALYAYGTALSLGIVKFKINFLVLQNPLGKAQGIFLSIDIFYQIFS